MIKITVLLLGVVAISAQGCAGVANCCACNVGLTGSCSASEQAAYGCVGNSEEGECDGYACPSEKACCNVHEGSFLYTPLSGSFKCCDTAAGETCIKCMPGVPGCREGWTYGCQNADSSADSDASTTYSNGEAIDAGRTCCAVAFGGECDTWSDTCGEGQTCCSGDGSGTAGTFTCCAEGGSCSIAAGSLTQECSYTAEPTMQPTKEDKKKKKDKKHDDTAEVVLLSWLFG